MDELVTILSLTPYECQMSHHAGARLAREVATFTKYMMKRAD